MRMIVYADILIGVNVLINYFLLLICGKFCKTGYKTVRIVLSALLGGILSLSLLLPTSPFIIELVFKAATSFLLVFIGFGFLNIKFFIRTCAVFLGLNFLFAGIVLFLWSTFKLQGVVINNGMVYFNISPLLLIISASASYLIITIIARFTKAKDIKEDYFKIKVFYKNNFVDILALKDTGNLLQDNISDRPVLIISNKKAFSLLQEDLSVTALPKNNIRGFRVLPFYTIKSPGLLPAFKCDYILVNNIKIHSVIIAVSENLKSNYDGLIGNEILKNIV